MTDETITADYVIIGSGAVGMAFADTILTETDATVAMIDRYQKPGGHWNVAYPFVRLHQPSSFYGVSSRELCKGRKDEVGFNKGLAELASGAEVLAYFDDVMRTQFLPSGRVQYFPMSHYEGDGVFKSLVSGKKKRAIAAKKMVDGTHLKTSVPSTHTPNFTIDDGVQFMPLNDLPKIETPPAGYVVIGCGKTGIDACLWLLENDVDPDTIRWIAPRDAWLLDRQNAQPSPEFFNDTMGAQAAQFEAIANATSIEDMFDRLESGGYFVRIDESVRPKMFHGATISKREIEALRQIKNVVRMGRVKSIHADRIVLDDGEIPTSPHHIHIDCSARAIANDEIKPIFNGDTITLQMVRSYQPVFSASFIAHIEATIEDEAEKNRLCGVVPLPNHDTDYLRFTHAFMMNQYNWSQIPELREWLLNNRLDGFSRLSREYDKEDTEKAEIMNRISANAPAAVMKLQQFLGEIA